MTTHQQALAILQQRQFEQLKGITDGMARQLRDITARGIAQGKTRTTIAADLSADIKGLSFNRAKTFAATQITDIHAEATLNTFQTVGVTEVKALVEFVTNVHGFSRVCPQCLALQGVTFTISEARGVIPVHANCQCGFVPSLAQAA